MDPQCGQRLAIGRSSGHLFEPNRVRSGSRGLSAYQYFMFTDRWEMDFGQHLLDKRKASIRQHYSNAARKQPLQPA